MPRKRASQVNNNLTNWQGPKLNEHNKENEISLSTHHFGAKTAIQITPFPKAHPIDIPLHHSKVPDVPMMPWSQQATVEAEEESDSDGNEEEHEEVTREEDAPQTHSPFEARVFIPAPDRAEAAAALVDLRLVIAPLRDSGIGHKDPKLNLLLRSRLEKMRMFLWMYTDPNNPRSGWQEASMRAAKAHKKGGWFAGRLREWARAYILDRNDLPLNPYGTWNSSVLDDEDFKMGLLLHLQSIGKYVRAMDIVDYVKKLAQLKLKKPISLMTAQRWMEHIGYRWLKTPSGQFVDGHERCDVVEYRQLVFLPVWSELLSRTRTFATDGNECPVLAPTTRPIVIWNHNESTYYANDRRKI